MKKFSQVMKKNPVVLEYKGEPGTLLFDDPLMRHGFTQVSNVVLKDSLLSSQEKILYILLLSYAWKEGHCFPGQVELAKHMGCTPLTIKRTLKKLSNYKLIKIKRQGLNRVNIYYIRELTDAYPLIIDEGQNF